MKNNNYIYKKLEKEIHGLERIIKHRNLYNIKNYIVTYILKTGVALDYSMPFILSGLILFYCFSEKGITLKEILIYKKLV